MLGFLKSSTSAGPAMVAPDRKSTPFQKLTVRAADEHIFFTSDGTERYLGACFLGVPITGADSSTVDKLRSALGMPLPAGSFVQIAQLASPDVDDYLDAFMRKKSGASEVPAELAQQQRNFVKSGVEKPLIERSGVLLHRKRLIVTIKIPCRNARPNPDDIGLAREQADRLQEGLKAAGLNFDALQAKGYIGLIRLIHNMWEPVDEHYEADKPIREQIYFPGDSVNFSNKKHIEFNDGEHYAKAMSVKYFPKRTHLGIMNYMIGDPHGTSNQIPDPYYMVLTLHYPDQVSKADWVRSRSAMINHQVFGPTAHMIPVLGYKKAGIDTLVHEMEGRGAVLCEANFTIFLFSKKLQKLNKTVAGLQAYFASLGFEMREDRRILEPLWNNLMPLNTTVEGIKNLFRFHSMAISHAVQFLPIIGEWTGSGPSGSVLMVTRRGQPALFDLYESPTNYNAVIFAEAGGGKSFLAQEIINAYLAEGAKVWAIDAGRSYYKLARAHKGQFIEFSPDSNICLNPFTFIENLEEEMDILKAMLAKMAAPEETLDDYRMALLEQAITAVYTKYGNNATITAVAEFCIAQPDVEAQRLGKQLYPFAGGSYTRWFDGKNNLDMDNAFVVMELQDLKGRKALQQVVLLQLMARINHEMFLTRGRKKILFIDEAWEMLDDPVMAKAMEAVYRKARKEEGAVIIVTQSVADLYNSPNARAIYENSAWQFILQQKAEAIDSAIEGGQFKIEQYGAHMLKSVHTIRGKYSEVMVKRSGNDWGILRLVVPRFKQVLYSTTGAERNDILDDLDRGVNVIDSINRFIKRENGEVEEELLAA